MNDRTPPGWVGEQTQRPQKGIVDMQYILDVRHTFVPLSLSNLVYPIEKKIHHRREPGYYPTFTHLASVANEQFGSVPYRNSLDAFADDGEEPDDSTSIGSAFEHLLDVFPGPSPISRQGGRMNGFEQGSCIVADVVDQFVEPDERQILRRSPVRLYRAPFARYLPLLLPNGRGRESSLAVDPGR